MEISAIMNIHELTMRRTGKQSGNVKNSGGKKIDRDITVHINKVETEQTNSKEAIIDPSGKQANSEETRQTDEMIGNLVNVIT